LGGAHRDFDGAAATLKTVLTEKLAELQNLTISQLIESRYQRLMSYGIVS
jgi:acetyl-CoA carboxylase carboxyl transferase subunit alpha